MEDMQVSVAAVDGGHASVGVDVCFWQSSGWAISHESAHYVTLMAYIPMVRQSLHLQPFEIRQA